MGREKRRPFGAFPRTNFRIPFFRAFRFDWRMSTESLWERFQKYHLGYDDLSFSIDISRMRFGDDFFDAMQPRVERAFAAMQELETGAIANPPEPHGEN